MGCGGVREEPHQRIRRCAGRRAAIMAGIRYPGTVPHCRLGCRRESAGKTVATSGGHHRRDSFDTALIRDHATRVAPNNSSALQDARIWHAHCNSSVQRFIREMVKGGEMSATLETASMPGVLSRAETQTERPPESEICKRLAHKVAVITGGSTGMGLATAKRSVASLNDLDRLYESVKGRDLCQCRRCAIGAVRSCGRELLRSSLRPLVTQRHFNWSLT
jgi:hypothetical protein